MPKTVRPLFKAKLQTIDKHGEAAVFFLAKFNGMVYKIFPGEKVKAKQWLPNKKGKGNGRLKDAESGNAQVNDRLDAFDRKLSEKWKEKPGLAPEQFRQTVFSDKPEEFCLPLSAWMEIYCKEPKRAMRRLDEIGPSQKESLLSFLRKLTEAPDIRQLAFGRSGLSLTYFEFIKDFVEKKKTEGLTTARKHLLAFAHLYGKFDFDDINWNWRDRFLQFCYTEEQCEFEMDGKLVKYRKKPFEQNYTAKVMAKVVQFVNAGRRAGLTSNTNVSERGFGVPFVDGNACILYESDFEIIDSLDLSHRPDLANVRNLALRGFCTGLRFSDWHKIDKKRIEVIPDRGRVMNIKTQKTKALVSIPVDSLFDRVLNEPDPYMMGYDAFNERLRELCELAGVTRLIDWTTRRGGIQEDFQVRLCDEVSAHDLRRSGLTRLALKGVPDRILRIISGHTTDNQLQKYLRIGDKLALLASVN